MELTSSKLSESLLEKKSEKIELIRLDGDRGSFLSKGTIEYIRKHKTREDRRQIVDGLMLIAGSWITLLDTLMLINK